jgi:hypothetical protein
VEILQPMNIQGGIVVVITVLSSSVKRSREPRRKYTAGVRSQTMVVNRMYIRHMDRIRELITVDDEAQGPRCNRECVRGMKGFGMVSCCNAKEEHKHEVKHHQPKYCLVERRFQFEDRCSGFLWSSVRFEIAGSGGKTHARREQTGCDDSVVAFQGYGDDTK